MRLIRIATSVLILAASVAHLHGQELEPRACSNSPIGLNFIILGYGYTTGSVLTDPASPVEDVTNEAHLGVLGLARVVSLWGQSAKLDCIIPFAGLTAKGTVFGQPHTRQISGLGDPFFRVERPGRLPSGGVSNELRSCSIHTQARAWWSNDKRVEPLRDDDGQRAEVGRIRDSTQKALTNGCRARGRRRPRVSEWTAARNPSPV